MSRKLLYIDSFIALGSIRAVTFATINLELLGGNKIAATFLNTRDGSQAQLKVATNGSN